VIKKTLDIEEKERSRQASRHGSVGSVNYRVHSISGTVIVSRAKLGWGKDVVGICIVYEVAGYDPL
jgi:hypothetical protein